MLRTSSLLPLALAVAFTLPACGSGDDRADLDPDTPAGAVAGLGVRNVAAPLPNLITAAQPTPDQVDRMVSLGYRSFVSLQLEGESGAGWEEEGIAAAGGRFVRIPVAGPDDLTRENVDKLAAILDEIGSEQAVLYCASSNRVGALLALKAYWLDGAEADEALALGRNAGMTGLEPSVRRILAADQ
jgi:protein tyrosine phosphatase (PTP) superfamily phosphohydrolase (DUF442 family)